MRNTKTALLSITFGIGILLNTISGIAQNQLKPGIDFLSIDFEGADPFKGLSISGNGEDGIKIETAPNPTGGKMLKIVDLQSPKSGAVAKGFKAQTGWVVFEMDIMGDKTEKGGPGIGFKSSGGAVIAVVSFSSSVITASDGASVVKIGSMVADVIKRLKIVFNFIEKKYSVYLDNKTLAEEISFRNDGNDISRIEITTPITSSLKVVGYIDNIKGYTEKAPAPVPGLVKLETQTLPIDHFNAKQYNGALFLLLDSEMAIANGTEKVIDKKNKGISPYLKNGIVYVPLGFIAESLESVMSISSKTGELNIKTGTVQSVVKSNSDTITVNGKPKKMDSAPMYIDKKPFVSLAMAGEALGKKTYYDPAGVIAVYSGNKPAKEDILKIKNLLVSRGEQRSVDKYSAVYLSSRAFREPDAAQPGTIDAMKRFNPTGMRWVYCKDPAKIQSMVKLGGILETAVEDQLADQPKIRESISGRNSESFEGKPIVISHIGSLPKVPCFNSPVWIEGVLSSIKTHIDNGAQTMQHDDWSGNINAYDNENGCFCETCLSKFNEYIKNKYSAAEIKGFGIGNISSFNYRAYLRNEYGFKNNSDYKKNRNKVPLDKVFKDFQYNTMYSYYLLLKEKAKEYSGGREIPLNGNMGHVPTWYDKEQFKLAYRFFDAGCGETDEEEYEDVADLLTGTLFTMGLGKTYTISPRSSRAELDVELNRRATAASYAMGNYFLIPWDVWLSRQPHRYYGTPAAYGDLYHFVRQYPTLFDKHEANPSVAIAVQWEELSNPQLRDTFKKLSFKLFQNGIPYKVVAVNRVDPEIHYRADQFEGITEIITIHEFDKFAEKDRQFIEACGIKLNTSAGISDSFLNKYSRVKVVSKGEQLYATVRETLSGEKAVHVINYKEEKANNVVVNIKELGSKSVMLYRPGFNPMELKSKNNTVTIPFIDEWAIIEVSQSIAGKEWSHYNVGMPSYASGVSIKGNDIEMSTTAPGFNYITGELDKVVGDYLSLSYKTIEEMDFSATGKIEKEGLIGVATTGLMVRDGISGNAPFAAIVYSQKEGYYFIYRSAYNKNCVKLPVSASGPYLKLEKSSDLITAYTSADNVNWNESGKTKLSLSRRIAGAFLSSDGKTAATSKIKGLEIQGKKSAAKIASINFVPEEPVISLSGEIKAAVEIILDNSEKSTPENTLIEYKSENKNVITINQAGLMTGIGEGESLITVKGSFGSSSMEKKFTMRCVKKVLIVDENFDDQKTGALPERWHQYGNNSEAAATIEIVPERNSKGMRLNDVSPGVLNVKQFFTKARKGTLTFEFDYFKEKQINKTSSLLWYIYSKNAPALGLAIRNQRFVWETDAKDLAPFEDGKWYKVQIVCDIPKQRAEVYIDNVLVGKDLLYKGVIEDINMVMLGAAGGSVKEISYFDNFKVYTGRP